MPVDYDKVKKIFLDAVKLHNVQDQKAFIEEACGPDIDLRNFIIGMHEAHQQIATPIPDGPTVFDAQAHASVKPALEIGTILDGRYKIIELIDEGGMGSVYRASRVTDLKMEVAIKVIKPGMDSQQVLARFNNERQALAMMVHENIARVLDAGMTDKRLPYFVMELVKGMNLTKFCDESKLPIQQRLELFEQICSAVQHAHQKGIVHRDLKPSNILVALYDDKPVPKVIDFGLAKALYQPLTDDDLRTKFGTFVGTWQYTAPEQARLNNLDIDTRADIYSLGVILYELLTGTTPLEKKRLINAAYEEVLRIIREEEPLKPSTRIHSSDELPSIAALRHTEPVKLERMIRGELDWIVMKALEKDRNRRYATANEFGRDINAFLHGEQIAAAPPSMGYRLSCFYRKNKGKILTAAAMLLLLIAGSIASTIGFIDASRSEKKALEQLAAANAMIRFIDKDMFSPIDPTVRAKYGLPMENNVLVRDLLDRSAANIEKGAFDHQPELELRIRHTIGKAYCSIGQFDQAAKHLAIAEKLANKYLGKQSEEYQLIVEHQGDVAVNKDNNEAANKYYDDVYHFYNSNYGKDDLRTIAIQLKILGIDRTLASTPEQFQQLESRADRLAQNLAIFKNYELSITAQLLQADLNLLLKRPQVAAAILVQALNDSKKNLGPDEPTTFAVMNNYANLLQQDKKNADAEAMYLDLISRAQRVLVNDDALIGLYKNNYAGLCLQMGKIETAHKMFREALVLFNRIASDHPYTLIIRANIASIKYLKKDYEGAMPEYIELVPLFFKKFGEQHPQYQMLLSEYARALIHIKKVEDALVHLRIMAKVAIETDESLELLSALSEIKNITKKEKRLEDYDKLISKLCEYLKEASTYPEKLITMIRSIE